MLRRPSSQKKKRRDRADENKEETTFAALKRPDELPEFREIMGDYRIPVIRNRQTWCCRGKLAIRTFHGAYIMQTRSLIRKLIVARQGRPRD